MSWAEEVLARREVWGRAPSAHNTQPWLVTVVQDGEDHVLRVGWDEARHLAVGDPTRRDLLLALGTLVQSLVVVAADLGEQVGARWEVDVATRCAATLHRTAPLQGDRPVPWTSADLVARRTARSAYREPGLTAAEVVEVAAAAQLPDRVGLEVVDPAWVDTWLPVADRWALEGPAAAELARWLRLSRRHPRYELDGLTDEALGLSRIEAAGLRLAVTGPGRAVLARTVAGRLVASSATARPLGTVVALTAPAGPSLGDRGRLGEALLRVWLAAADRGWSAHPLSALLDCPESLAAWPAARGRAPVAVFRLGVPTRPASRSARLPQPPVGA